MSDFNIVQVGKELRTDSRSLAQALDHRHRTILESIDKYIDEFSELNLLQFRTEARIEGSHGGGDVRYAMLSEDQCYFLLTLMRNNKHVVKCKLALVKAFRDARNHIAKRDVARLDGKTVRQSETKAISQLVEYARGAGSQNADKYYQSVTRMTNDLLGIESGKRDLLDERQLRVLAQIESMVEIAIMDGIGAKMEYKDIYRLAKDRCGNLAQLLITK